MKVRRFAVLLALLLSACANPSSLQPPLEYKQLGQISLDVRDLSFVDRGIDQPPALPVVSGQFKPTIADAVHRWATERLQAVGTAGEAAFVVKDAYVTEQVLPADTSGIMNWMQRRQGSKYIGHVEIEFDARGREGYALATANASRSVSLPENPDEGEKQEAYKTLLNGMMQDLDHNLDQAIHEHMKDFIVTAPVIGSKLPEMPIPKSPGQSP